MAHDLSYSVMSSREVSEDCWRTIQELQADAFAAVLPEQRTLDDIDVLVGMGDSNRFIETHRNPNVAVGNEFSTNQHFYRPQVVIAESAGNVIGYLYSALNVSGNGLARATKHVMYPEKEYTWLRETAVAFDYQHKGVARAMLAVALKQRDARHPVTAYVWPEETPKLYETLTSLTTYRMQDTGHKMVQPYGESAGDVTQHRLQGHAREVILAAVGRDGRQHPEVAHALRTAKISV